MWEIVKEFLNLVMSGVGKEMSRLGSGAAITFFCMIAFVCIVAGIFLESRCVSLYYLTSEGKRKLLGSILIQRQEGNYKVRIPGHFFEKSESIYYYLQMPEDFAHRHYMEEVMVELPSGRKRLAIKKQIQFKSGLR